MLSGSVSTALLLAGLFTILKQCLKSASQTVYHARLSVFVWRPGTPCCSCALRDFRWTVDGRTPRALCCADTGSELDGLHLFWRPAHRDEHRSGSFHSEVSAHRPVGFDAGVHRCEWERGGAVHFCAAGAGQYFLARTD